MDTSLVVALFASWHEAHRTARAAVPIEAHLPAHVLLESYSVLTRLPPPHRVPADVAAPFLRRRFQPDLLVLPAEAHRDLLSTALQDGIAGGAVYDLLVAATAKHAGATLLSRDRRAARTYDLIGATYELVA